MFFFSCLGLFTVHTIRLCFSSNEQQLAKDHVEIQAPFGSCTSGGRRATKDGAAAPKVTIVNRHRQRKIQIKSESKFLESTPFFF